MFDLFGSKRRSVLSSEQFQENLIRTRDLRQLILKMSSSDTPPEIFIERDDNFANGIISSIQFTLTTFVYNPDLRLVLNKFYEDFYLKKIYEFHYDSSLHSNMTHDQIDRCIVAADDIKGQKLHATLDEISHALFRDNSTFSLYETYKHRYGTDVYDFVYGGLGMDKTYTISREDFFPFSLNLIMKTAIPNEYNNGRKKSESAIQDERKFYTKIFLEELAKI